MKRTTRGWLIASGLLILVLGLLVCLEVPSLRPPVATVAAPIPTPLGLIQGKSEAGLTVYRGIPYAAPPVGELRWRPPAAANWSGTLRAERFKPEPMATYSLVCRPCHTSRSCTPRVTAQNFRTFSAFHRDGYSSLPRGRGELYAMPRSRRKCKAIGPTSRRPVIRTAAACRPGRHSERPAQW